MNENALADYFEAERTRLHAVAYRLLGSAGEADDAVQEAWLRLSRADRSEVENLGSWLTTVVARVCLDMLRSRRARREQPLAEDGEFIRDTANPEREAVVAESLGLAMLAVLDRLEPAERVAFVLHDVFGVAHDDIAHIVGRTPAARHASWLAAAVTGCGARPRESRHETPGVSGKSSRHFSGLRAPATSRRY